MKKKSLELKEHFEADLQLSEEITLEDWKSVAGLRNYRNLFSGW